MPPTVRVILHPVRRGGVPPVYPLGPVVCLVWEGGEALVPPLPLVVVCDSVLKMGEALFHAGEGGRAPPVLRLERIRGGRVVPLVVRFVLPPVG